MPKAFTDYYLFEMQNLCSDVINLTCSLAASLLQRLLLESKVFKLGFHRQLIWVVSVQCQLYLWVDRRAFRQIQHRVSIRREVTREELARGAAVFDHNVQRLKSLGY